MDARRIGRASFSDISWAGKADLGDRNRLRGSGADGATSSGDLKRLSLRGLFVIKLERRSF